MAMKQSITRCNIFVVVVVVVVGFSLLVCLFVCFLFWPMLLSGKMSDMQRLNASNECRACSTAGHVLLRGKTLMMLTLERYFYRFTA